jgi:hypothetical protein
MIIAGATKCQYTGTAGRIARTICKKGRANAKLFDATALRVMASPVKQSLTRRVEIASSPGFSQ